jgi:hypothetical protein
MKNILTVLLIAASSLASGATGPEFAGKWIHIQFPGVRAKVEANGPNYIFTTYNDRIVQKYVAVAESGLLKISAGPREVKADIDAHNGHLIFGGQEYRRLRPGESFEYVPKGIPRF